MAARVALAGVAAVDGAGGIGRLGADHAGAAGVVIDDTGARRRLVGGVGETKLKLSLVQCHRNFDLVGNIGTERGGHHCGVKESAMNRPRSSPGVSLNFSDGDFL